MSVMPMPKIVDVEETTVELPRELYVRLTQTADMLATDLGFPVTIENAIAWLWKFRMVDYPKHIEEVNRRLAQTQAHPDAPAQLQATFEDDFAAIVAIPQGMSVSDVNETRRLMAGQQKINAIKLVREKTHFGLKEAKDWVEKHFKYVSA